MLPENRNAYHLDAFAREDYGPGRWAMEAQGVREGMLDRVEFALAVAVVFFSPMNFLRLPTFYFTLSDALACLSLFLLVARGRLVMRPIGPLPTAVWMTGLALLLSGLLASSMINGNAIRGLVYVAQYFFAYFLLLLVIGGRSERQTIILAKAYLLCIVLMCLHGIYVITVEGQTNNTFVSGSGRLMGFVERENECAAMIALAIPMLLYLTGSGRITRLALLAVPVMGYGVMLTGSNTGLASFALAIGLMALLTMNVRYFVPAAAFSAFSILAIGIWARDYLPATFQRRVLGALESGDIGQAGTFDERMDLIREAIGRADGTLLLGLGADQYAATSFLQQPVHNLYLLLWTEGGVLCMIGFITMIAAGFGPALTAWKHPAGRVVAACTFASLSLYLLEVNAFANVYGRFWAVPVILAVSLAYAVDRRVAKSISI